jgi:hypothetical protein
MIYDFRHPLDGRQDMRVMVLGMVCIQIILLRNTPTGSLLFKVTTAAPPWYRVACCMYCIFGFGRVSSAPLEWGVNNHLLWVAREEVEARTRWRASEEPIFQEEG